MQTPSSISLSLQLEPEDVLVQPPYVPVMPAGLSIAATRVVPIDTTGADAVIYQPEPEDPTLTMATQVLHLPAQAVLECCSCCSMHHVSCQRCSEPEPEPEPSL